LNTRPTRVPSPSAPDESIHPDRMADADRAIIEQRVNHSPPAVRQQAGPQVHATVSERTEPEQPALPATPFAKLAGAIAAVMAEIKPVEKEGWNDFQKYNYARMQDLSRELTPLMGKHGIVIFQTEEGREMFDDGKAVAVRYRFTIVHSSGEIWPERPLQTGLSSCRNSKGGFDDKTLNKCHTSARKYFLLSLFQIPTADEDDADSGGDGEHQQSRPQQRPQGRRPVPSPNGKVPPHLMPIIDKEAPESWTKRFGEVVAKATTVAEIDQWYDANASIFEKLKRFEDVYNAAIDHMDACAAKLAPKSDPISSGKQEGSFPGDTPMKTVAPVDTSIPLKLDRALTEPEQDWLLACDETFVQCDSLDALDTERESIMLPSQDSVSGHAWARAEVIWQNHRDRISGG
jgi:hypothetical protein